MIRMLLLLLGSSVVQRRWRLLVAIGLLWSALGGVIFADALDDVALIPIHQLGWFVIAEAALILLGALAPVPGRRARGIKGGGLLLIGLLTVHTPWHSDVLLAVLIALSFAADGAFRIVAARIVRFPHWRSSLWMGVLELLLALATLQPLPTWYVGTIGCNIGLLMVISGIGAMQIGRRLRALPRGAPVSMLLGHARHWHDLPEAGPAPPGTLTVHVWTPLGALGGGALGTANPQRRPLVDRYIAAVDAAGTISTGHAALELAPDLYISHYPAVEIDRSPGEFTRVLRATAENDVPGRFLPSYAAEAAGWCEATDRVAFRNCDARRLRGFWAAYRRDSTYNLTSRNCSSAVAHALDAAFEGIIGTHRRPVMAFLIVLMTPELWIAAMLRKQAEAMAWTPGLVLDYARALKAVVEPMDLPLLRAVDQLRRRMASERS
jgi:uncharacterized membrane protein HdeD (DUF308 family)